MLTCVHTGTKPYSSITGKYMSQEAAYVANAIFCNDEIGNSPSEDFSIHGAQTRNAFRCLSGEGMTLSQKVWH